MNRGRCLIAKLSIELPRWIAPQCVSSQLQDRRLWSSGATGDAGGAAPAALPLKVAIKSLFLKVHPDLFTEWPAEQAENQRSFQLLQEYLDLAKREPGDAGPAARTPYRFRFFLRPQEDAEATDFDATDEGDDAKPVARAALARAEVTLPPPEPSPGGGGALSAATKKALAKLLGMCGLTADLADTQEEQAARQRLLVFLPEAAEVVRQAESGGVGWEVQAANMRGAMRLARQVVVGFGPGDFPGPRQVELLQALARVLDELATEGADVTGAHIMFGSKTVMDVRGTLWLDASEEDREFWADFLGGADLRFAASRREAAAALRRLEGAVAGAAGLGMVFAPAALAMTPDYRLFLERLAKHSAQYGPVAAAGAPRSSPGSSSSSSSSSEPGTSRAQTPPPFSELPLYVAPLQSSAEGGAGGGSGGGGAAGSGSGSGSGSGRGSGFEVSEGMGCLQVPVSAEAHQVYGFVQDRGAEALRALTQRRSQEARVEDLSARVRRRLRLRRLTRDPLITHNQFESACARLLQHAAALLQSAEGLSVRVSDANRVEGQSVDIAWDAEP